jgi:predicted permease
MEQIARNGFEWRVNPMKKQTNRPPRLAQWILGVILNQDDKDVLLGDFKEFFEEKTRSSGRLRAHLWYWAQCMKTFPRILGHIVYWQIVMLHNYLKIGFRIIRKQKYFASINILGLAIGLTAGILIMMWVQDELSYDRFHTRSENLYRIESDISLPSGARQTIASPHPLAAALPQQVPGVVCATPCTRFGGMLIRHKDKIFHENDIRAVNPSFFRMFNFSLLSGDPEEALESPFSIILTTETAEKYFGPEDPVGKTVTVENKWEFTVTGVIDPAPPNSTIQFSGLVRLEFVRDQLERMPYGWVNAISNFALLQPDTDPARIGNEITRLVQQHSKKENVSYRLKPIHRLHLHTTVGAGQGMGAVRYVYIFSSIALFVIIIACINFINLSTARSASRAREIGLRKVVGARRNNLIRQFLGESYLLTFLALIIAMGAVLLLLIPFNTFSGKSLTPGDLFSGKTLLMILGVLCFTGLVAGIYPAVILSGFQPAVVLKNRAFTRSGRGLLRKTLVVFQFTLSIFLIFGTLTVFRQVTYMRQKNLGMDIRHIAAIRMSDEASMSYETLRQELMQNPNVLGVSACGRLPLIIGDRGQNLDWEGRDPDNQEEVVFHTVDYDYFTLMNMPVVDGRAYSRKFASDTTGAFVINQSLAQLVGNGESVLGKAFKIFWMKGKIIGVVKDFHHLPMQHTIKPMVLILTPNLYWRNTLLVKTAPQDIQGTMDFVSKTWKRIVPGNPFDSHFLDDDFNRLYRRENQLGLLMSVFSILALFVACMGLFGLSLYNSAQRTGEIGIRKVMGARIFQIVLLFTKEFIGWILIACFIALPSAWLVLGAWMRGFAYRTAMGWDIYLLSGGLGLSIAILTVGFQAFQAARQNPVQNLRYE